MKMPDETISLRDAHKGLTKKRILDSALDLIRRGEMDGLTIASVAKAAAVTERTIYRHFATRDDFLRAVWARVNEQVRTPAFPAAAAELVAQPRRMFPEFDAEASLMRAIVSTKQGQELRLSVNASRQAAVRAAVKQARCDLEEPDLTKLCAVVQLLDSSFAWLVMKDYWGLDGVESGEAASQAIAVLLRMAPDFASVGHVLEEEAG